VLSIGVGLTSIVKLFDVPVQPLAVVFTVITAVTGAAVALVAVNAAILPVPDAGRPIVGSEFVQLKIVLATEPVKLTAVVMSPLHTTWLGDGSTSGDGLTVIVNVCAVPTQPLSSGVTLTTPEIGVLPVFVAVNAPILPEPEAARPIEGLLFVHTKEVPDNEPVNVTAVVEVPSHTI